jgi:hypothetical protein
MTDGIFQPLEVSKIDLGRRVMMALFSRKPADREGDAPSHLTLEC